MIIGVDARELSGRPTGAGRYLKNLLVHWAADARHTLIVYCAGASPTDAARSVPVQPRVIGRTGTSSLIWRERDLVAAARQDAVDVFFSPAYFCPLRLDVPRVTAVHDLSFFNWPHDFPLSDGVRRRVLIGASIRASMFVLACSEFSRQEIATRFPAEMRKVRHIPLGPDDDLPEAPARDEARRRLGLEGPLLLTVGSILNRRRVMELLAAVRRLIAGHPKLRLEIVGDNRTTPRIDLDALIAEWHLTEHVRLSGFVSETELACRYAAADLAIFLSEYEGFGLPALEAMSRNVPVIVANRPSLSEVFHSAALLVEPDDVTSIAAGIDGLLRSVALRQALVARGRLLAARYSWAQTAALTLETLEEAAAQ